MFFLSKHPGGFCKGCETGERLAAFFVENDQTTLNQQGVYINILQRAKVYFSDMHLLDNVTTEVYKAYFPRSISSSAAVDLAAPDKGSEHNYKKWPPQEKSPFFPADQICAEDPDWDTSDNCPPSLSARCIQTLARFFSVKPERTAGLKGGDRAKFLNLLSTNEPILLTAEKISDELYWKRCCIDHLISYDNSKHGGSYKRLFLEKHLQSCIEAFVPQQTDLFDIKDLLGVMEPFIKRLEITELLPPELLLVSYLT